MSLPLIYVDHAATTPVREEVAAIMMDCLRTQYGNPSSLHRAGREAKLRLDTARRQVADGLHAQPDEIFFTSGGSESDNWAIRGGALLGEKRGRKHLITSAIEHPAVLRTVEALEKEGFAITLLPVSSEGMVSAEDVSRAIRPDTALVSIMYANNEVGTLQPIAEVAELCHRRGVLFHTDAVQATGQIPIDLSRVPIDLLSLSGHKLHGPKGVGALFVRRGLSLPSLLLGGGQERGRRAGTENVPAIAGLGKAMELACAELEEGQAKTRALRDRLIAGLLDIPGCTLNGHPTQRLPGNVNLCFDGVEGEALVAMLDLRGVCASTGSACHAGISLPSHVLTAMGVEAKRAMGAVRLSLCADNTEEEVSRLLEILPDVVARLRDLSPDWERR